VSQGWFTISLKVAVLLHKSEIERREFGLLTLSKAECLHMICSIRSHSILDGAGGSAGLSPELLEHMSINQSSARGFVEIMKIRNPGRRRSK
jgi:hypothetical protein